MGPLFLAAMMSSSSAQAAEPVTITVEPAASLNQRAVVEWELAVTDPTGGRQVRSGVVRGTWIFDAQKVSLSEVQRVRSSPRVDAVASEITGALLEGFVASRAVAEPPASVVEPAAAPPAAEAPATVEGEADAEEVDATAAPEPVVPAPAVVAPAPAEALPAPIAPGGAPNLGVFLADALASASHRVAWSFDGAQVLPGEAVPLVDAQDPRLQGATSAAARASAPSACPNTGPTRQCVELTVARAMGSAHLEGTLPAGSSRTVDSWMAEPSTLVPHAAFLTAETAWEVGAGEPKPGVWQAKAQVWVSLAPWSPPTSP